MQVTIKKKNKILFVGGLFSNIGGWKSSLITQAHKCISDCFRDDYEITLVNGGSLGTLETLLEVVTTFNTGDIILWWADVPNEYLKIRNIKELAPKAILVTSKRNDNSKYSFLELINHSLELKANLTVEFSKILESTFNMRVFDPLGVVWYEGVDIGIFINVLLRRAVELSKFTRQSAIRSQEKSPSIKKDMSEFITLVNRVGIIFTNLVQPANGVTRFLGNASFREKVIKVKLNSFRGTKGFPSFRQDELIYVTQRNVDKSLIDIDHFVPVKCSDGTLEYFGENKPSVDTPIQVRLYKLFPQINYMIHAHCYINGAHFTKNPIPCGAMEEVLEIFETAVEHQQEKDKLICINLIGHGCIAMVNTIEELYPIVYQERLLPGRIN